MSLELKPEMHEEFKMNQRVEFDIDGKTKGKGTVIGISSIHVIFHYIILLDKPLDTSFGKDQKAISLSGCQLKKIDDGVLINIKHYEKC